MTDYGRGSGSEPWHPEDPLFGDVYEQGQPGGGGQYAQQQPQQPGWQDPYATGGHYASQGYPQQSQPGQQPQYQQQPYPQGGYDPYDTGSYQTGGYAHQDPYGGQQAHDPYAGGGRPDYYGQGGYPPPQQPQFRGGPQPGMAAGPGMGGPGPGIGQTQAMGRVPGMPGGPGGHPEDPGSQPLRTAPGNTGQWDPEDDEDAADPRDHAFFSGRDDDDDDDDRPSDGRGRRSSGSSAASSRSGRKRRSGCACLVVALVLAGGVGGAGYFGYTFYESHFGPAPDYSGNGTGDVQVEIPEGSTLTAMGNILKQAGVVKSVDAFAAAANKNPKGRSIQAGIYVLHKQMSAAAAVTMMLDPASQSAMIVSEGMRDQDVYAAIDKRLGLAAGSTAKVAQAQWRALGLPSWADSAPHIKDPLEGFLFPSRYSVAKGMKPETVLRNMVGQAKQQYAKFDLAGEAKKEGLNSPLQLITVASLVQAEGKTDDDFRKMAKVVYNRMVPNNPQTAGFLQFDSTYNYIKNAHATSISIDKMKTLDDPYNTYKYKGLPPGPIGNPGIVALQAAMHPDPGNWYYFISLDGKTTKFTETQAEFNRLYQQYNKQ